MEMKTLSIPSKCSFYIFHSSHLTKLILKIFCNLRYLNDDNDSKYSFNTEEMLKTGTH